MGFRTKIVAIGASAGGLAAMKEFFAALPKDTDMSFIITRHVGYDVKSDLDEILRRETNMPVYEIEKETLLEANCLYLASTRCNIVVLKHHVKAIPRPPQDEINFSIDEMFHTLGRAVGRRGIAVVLSGAGTDGSRGVVTVSDNGGLVLVQEPETATFDSMPIHSIRTQHADYVLSPGDLARVVGRLAEQGTSARNHIEESAYTRTAPFQEVLQELSTDDVQLDGYQTSYIIRQLEKNLYLTQSRDLSDYLQLIRQQPKMGQLFFKDFVLDFTHFFRNPEAFQYLEQNVIAKLARKADASLRVWTVGSATGEEAISLGILFLEHISERTSLRIFASDINASATYHARMSTFKKYIEQDVPPEYLHRYFRHTDGIYSITDPLRDAILFINHNALKDPAFWNLDLISCRYLFHFLSQRKQQELLGKLKAGLKQGGYLFLGLQERVPGIEKHFHTVSKKYSIYQKK